MNYKVEISKAHNGVPTAKIDGTPLHSSYDPLKEAEKIVEEADCHFAPNYIFVIEPGLSYCADFFRKSYPNARLCALHFIKNFAQTDSKWDKVFIAEENSNLAEQIFAYMGDEGVVTCFFWCWPSSDKIFPDETSAAWAEIKKAVLKTRSVLNTRAFFAKRWIKNSFRFCLFSNFNAYILKGQSQVVVCASGPSLKSSIPYLKQYRDSFFLIAVSSALAPLLNEGIIPDLCISTDGGYWAKHHLSFGLEKYNIPLALPLEGTCYSRFLDGRTVIPISYGDGIAESLISMCNYINIRAIRNGTVSGTAADFALNITSGEIFFCGLDLCENKGFSHMQPNELEINESRYDNRLRTTETRITPSTFKSPAQEIYRNWFSTTKFFNRVYRLSDKYPYPNKLGEVYDVDWTFFRQHLSTEVKTKPIVLYLEHKFELKDRIVQISSEIKKNTSNPEWIKCTLPQEQIKEERLINPEEKKEVHKQIINSMEKFIDEVLKTFNKGLKL